MSLPNISCSGNSSRSRAKTNRAISDTIRLATADDADQIAEIYAPIVRDTPISFEIEPPTTDEMRQRILKTLAQFPWLVYDQGARVQGYAYASAHRTRAAYQWSVDVSVYVHQAARRHGVGAALYTSLFRLLTLQGFYQAYAGIALPNPASVGLHESLGFKPVGVYRSVGYKQGAWHDVEWWQLSLQPPTVAPADPLGLAAAAASRDWELALQAGLPLLRTG